MRKLIAIGLAGLLFSGSASAQGALINALVGPQGVVESLGVTLATGDAEPLVNSFADTDSGLLQGTASGGLNDVLSGLLVDQDPGRIQTGLETILGSVGRGVTRIVGDNPAGGIDVPALDGVPLSGDLTGALYGVIDLDGSLPGLPGGGGALSLEQLEQVTSLLSL